MPIVVRKKYDQMHAEFLAECRRIAKDAFRQYCANPCQALYLFGTRKHIDTLNPQNEIWASFAVRQEPEDGEYIVRQDHLPRHLTVDHLAWTVSQWLSREPMWIFAG